MRLRLLLMLLFIAALFGMMGAVAAGMAEEPAFEEQGDAMPLSTGALTEVDLDRGERAWRFTAPSGSIYDIWLFPAGEEAPSAHVELWQEGRRVAASDDTMPAIRLRLAAGAEYILRVRGSGCVRMEVARHTRSRCFDLPMMLDGGGDAYAKAFARSGDAHWFAVDATTELPLALTCVPASDGMRLKAELIDESGRVLAEGTSTEAGSCMMDLLPEAGRRYRVRLRAEDGATGLYELRLTPLPVATLADKVTLSKKSLVLEGRQQAVLGAIVSPRGAGGVLLWESSDASVAAVDDEGRVSGLQPGTAMITAYAAGGVSDRCRVQVRRVPVTGVAMLSGQMTLSVGDDAAVECEVFPSNASDAELEYDVSPDGVVQIDSRGVLRGLAEGEATVTARSRDGGFSDTMTVTVGPAPRRRWALLVGEQNYASTVAEVRTGSINSVTGMRSMLESQSVDGAKYQVTTLLDVSRDKVLSGIQTAFSDAAEGDVSLFYISCHGYYAGGMTCFQMYDGSVLSAEELAAALRRVRGEMLVMIDCCGSGGVIAHTCSTGDILKGIDRVFGGTVGPAVMGTSRFRVLASAALEQDSYRVSFTRAASESEMATVFARAVCEAGGWSIDRAARDTLRADLDHDSQVTLSEVYSYVSRRVMWFLSLTGASGSFVQSVQVWPEGDMMAVFGR